MLIVFASRVEAYYIYQIKLITESATGGVGREESGDERWPIRHRLDKSGEAPQLHVRAHRLFNLYTQQRHAV
jgi:hypothetical protein